MGIGLTEPIPDFITLEAAIAELARQGAAILVPHPAFLTVSLSAYDVRRFRDDIDAIETFNPKHLPIHNRRARSIARSVGIPGFASSYSHLRGTVGEAWTTFPDCDVTMAAVVDALKAGGSRSLGRRSGVVHGLRRGLEISHLLYENTVEKIDRVILEGREATHPGHPAYEGRFDEVAVYDPRPTHRRP